MTNAADDEVEDTAVHSFLVEVLSEQIKPKLGITLNLPDSVWHLPADQHLVRIIGVDHEIIPELVLVHFVGTGEVLV